MKRKIIGMILCMLMMGSICACDEDEEYEEVETFTEESEVINSQVDESDESNTQENFEITEGEIYDQEAIEEVPDDSISDIKEEVENEIIEFEFDFILKTYVNGNMWVRVPTEEIYCLVDNNLRVLTVTDDQNIIDQIKYCSDCNLYMQGPYLFDENINLIESKLENLSAYDSYDVAEGGLLFYFETVADFEKSTQYLCAQDIDGNVCIRVEWDDVDKNGGIQAIKMSDKVYMVIANRNDGVYWNKAFPYITLEENAPFDLSYFKSILINIETGEKINLYDWDDNEYYYACLSLISDEKGNLAWIYGDNYIEYSFRQGLANDIDYEGIHSKEDLVAQLKEGHYTNFINNRFWNIEKNAIQTFGGTTYDLVGINGNDVPYLDNENIQIVSSFGWGDNGEYFLELLGADKNIYYTCIDSNGIQKCEPAKSTFSGVICSPTYFKGYVIGYDSENYKLIALDQNCNSVEWNVIQELFEDDEIVRTAGGDIITKDKITILPFGFRRIEVYDYNGNLLNKVYYEKK